MAQELKNKRIIFRVTENERQDFDLKVNKANTTASNLLRERVLNDNLIIVAKPAKQSKDKKQLIYLYNKTSNNLNQLAYLANSHNKAGTLTEKQHQSILANLITIRNLLKSGIDNVD
ncbi:MULTISPECIES: plasmid mobilization protein [Photobacterium]|nr:MULTISPECIES: mobilization protein [Photobacterium]